MIARRIILALVMSLLGSAVFTFWLSHRFLSGKQRVEAPKTQKYVALAKSMEAGELVTAASVKMVDWPASSTLEGAFPKADLVVGRTLLYPLAEGEPVLDRQLSAAGSGSGLAYKIPEGMRAISLKSDQVVGVAGFLLPGTHVDVLVTYHPQASPFPVTTTVLQDAQVLAAGQQSQPDAQGKPATTDVVTLLATPEDAERVVLASAQGTVHFILRNGADHKHVDGVPEVSQFDGSKPLLTGTAGGKSNVLHPYLSSLPHAVEKKEAPKPYVVQMIYGNRLQEPVK